MLRTRVSFRLAPAIWITLSLVCGGLLAEEGEAQGSDASSTLDSRLSSRLVLKDTAFTQAVRTLASAPGVYFRYSLEYREAKDGSHDPSIKRLALDAGSSLREALDRLTAEAPGWHWNLADGVVGFTRGNLRDDPAWPLNRTERVVNIEAERSSLPKALKKYILGLVVPATSVLDEFEAACALGGGVCTIHAKFEDVSLRTVLDRFITNPEYVSRGVFYCWSFCVTSDGKYQCRVEMSHWSGKALFVP